MTPPILSPLSRLSKLRSMSAAEVMHRIRYAAFISRERRDYHAGSLAPPDRLGHALVDSLRGSQWEQRLIASRAEQRHRFFRAYASLK